MPSYTQTRRVAALSHAMGRIGEYMERSTYMRRAGDPAICDFAFGNPHDMPMPNYVDVLQRALVPEDKNWFAYKMNEPASQQVVASSLSERFGMPFEPDDIALTAAGFAAIFVALTAVVDAGDEVIFNLPPWFFYGLATVAAGGVPVTVPVDAATFDLNLAAIEAAITPRTRAIIVNTPCNPTGKIYPPETLERLAILLDEASRRNDRTIYLISDEAYNRIVFDGIQFHTPLEYYPNAMMAYSYGKTLMAPGQRIGYLALPPTMPDREQLHQDIFVSQVTNAWAFPNAQLLHALPDLDQLRPDVERLQRKRDRMVGALRDIGYDVHMPEGTFYLFPRSPIADDWAFVELLEQREIFCHPGTISEVPGHFRISLTANEDMIERSLPGFQSAIDEAHRLVTSSEPAQTVTPASTADGAA
ncbi:MAG: aminotransferase class I/II-fold pyridoxal phosphate-dependent enzyme [Thermomicrobiales bacterium]